MIVKDKINGFLLEVELGWMPVIHQPGGLASWSDGTFDEIELVSATPAERRELRRARVKVGDSTQPVPIRRAVR